MENRSSMALRAVTISLALLSAGAAACADLKIDSLKNPNKGLVLSDEQMKRSEPTPLMDLVPLPTPWPFPDRPDDSGKSDDNPAVSGEGTEKVAHPEAAPYSSAGKLHFTVKPGSSGYCTAQFVGSVKVILTAAHCVKNPATGAWYSNFTFVPAAPGPKGEPAKSVGWACVSLYKQFVTPDPNGGKATTEPAFDYAFILTTANSTTGALTLLPQAPATTDVTAIGYPGNLDGGQFMYQATGAWQSIPPLLAMSDNAMEHGSSGGAWFSDFDVKGGQGKNRVVSLNSHAGSGVNVVNGPPFDGNTSALQAYVSGARCMN